jgi:hypothetical protein
VVGGPADQLRSARAARLPLVSLLLLDASLLPEVEPLEPIVLPLLLGVLAEPEALLDGVLEEPEELVAGGVLVLELELEPLAPIEVPLLLGVLLLLESEALGELLELEPLGELEELEELGVAVLPLLEPEAPIVLVERSFGLVPEAEPPVLAAGELALLPPAAVLPPVLLPELWAMAKPPNARAAAAATVVRVVLIMSNSLIELPTRGWDGKAPAGGAG